jgi:hypothetical protein
LQADWRWYFLLKRPLNFNVQRAVTFQKIVLFLPNAVITSKPPVYDFAWHSDHQSRNSLTAAAPPFMSWRIRSNEPFFNFHSCTSLLLSPLLSSPLRLLSVKCSCQFIQTMYPVEYFPVPHTDGVSHHLSRCYLARFTLLPWWWRRYIATESSFTFSRLHCFI